MLYTKRIASDRNASLLNGSLPLSQPLRVLIVDDDEDDFVIARDLLREADALRYTIEWAEDAESAFARLESEPPCHVCLLDYRLRRCNGLDLLRDLRARGHRLPVILLTGQDDRDVDEEAVRRGASDYLIKDRIDAALLERSIRYALRQASTEDTLRQQGGFVSAILDTAGALVAVFDVGGNFVRFNRACEELSGWTATEIEGHHFSELVPPDQTEYVRQIGNRLWAGESPVHAENDWVGRTGERRQIAWANTVLCNDAGQIEFVVSTGIDVTERRRAEAALAEAREREIAVGASIQRQLLFRRPPAHLPGVAIGAISRAAQRVGGDYADFFIFAPHCLDLLVGDVMGKGVSAALLSAAAKSEFQRVVRRLSLDLVPFRRLPEPDEIVSAVHAAITRELMDMDSFVTLSYARLERERDRLLLVDCGHPRPLHYVAARDEWQVLEGENTPLGMNAREVYRQTSVPVAPGDVLFFYSDGISEACNASDEMWGEQRLLENLCELRHLPPQELVEEVCRRVDNFRDGGIEDGDDMTAIALRIEPWSLPPRRGWEAIEVSSDPDKLETVREFVESVSLKFGGTVLGGDDRDRLLLALNEAAANVMRHAYGGRIDGRVRVEAEAFADRLIFRLHDNGKPFPDRNRIPPPSFDGSRDSGFGLYLMELALDDIEYVRDDMGRNTLTLTRYLTGRVADGKSIFHVEQAAPTG